MTKKASKATFEALMVIGGMHHLFGALAVQSTSANIEFAGQCDERSYGTFAVDALSATFFARKMYDCSSLRSPT